MLSAGSGSAHQTPPSPGPICELYVHGRSMPGVAVAVRSVWSRVDMRSAHPRFNMPSRFWPYLSRPEAVWAEIWPSVKLRIRRFHCAPLQPQEIALSPLKLRPKMMCSSGCLRQQSARNAKLPGRAGGAPACHHRMGCWEHSHGPGHGPGTAKNPGRYVLLNFPCRPALS